jgi:hypothetical protein
MFAVVVTLTIKPDAMAGFLPLMLAAKGLRTFDTVQP